MTSTIEYGAWAAAEHEKRRVLVRIPEAKFRELLTLAFRETKDLDLALDRLKQEVEALLRRR